MRNLYAPSTTLNPNNYLIIQHIQQTCQNHLDNTKLMSIMDTQSIEVII